MPPNMTTAAASSREGSSAPGAVMFTVRTSHPARARAPGATPKDSCSSLRTSRTGLMGPASTVPARGPGGGSQGVAGRAPGGRRGPDARQEARHEVGREGEVAEGEPQADPDAPRERAVAGDATEQ